MYFLGSPSSTLGCCLERDLISMKKYVAMQMIAEGLHKKVELFKFNVTNKPHKVNAGLHVCTPTYMIY